MDKEMQPLPINKALLILSDKSLVWETKDDKLFTHKSKGTSIRTGKAKDTVVVDYHGPDTYGTVFITALDKGNKEALEFLDIIKRNIIEKAIN